MLEGGATEENQKRFKDNVLQLMDHDESLKNFIEFDLVFFPIDHDNHYFLICFHMKNGKILLIDNNMDGKVFMQCHGDIPPTVVNFFISYLKDVQHPAVRMFEKSNIRSKIISWGTKEEGKDSGVFVMRHMETYQGKDPWDSGLKTDESAKSRQLQSLRTKYAVKMLTHELNNVKEEVLQRFENYEKQNNG